MPKKPFQRRSISRRSLIKKILFSTLLFISAAGIIAGFWVLSILGPKKVDYSNLELAPIDTEAIQRLDALLETSLELESKFDERLVLRHPNQGDLLVLLEAVTAQREYVTARPNCGPDEIKRLKDLEIRYQNYASKEKYDASIDLEKRALDLAGEGKIEEAHGCYLEALEMQEALNEEFPLSESHDSARIARLRRSAEFLLAEPLYRASLELEQKADSFLANKNWEEAQSAYEQAVNLQDQLISEHRGTKQADMVRLGTLKNKLIGALSAEDHIQINETAELAEARQIAGDHLEAASYYNEAARLQKQLNAAFPDSPYASPESVTNYLRRSQTSQSYQLAMEIEANHERLLDLLSTRQTHEAIETIVDLRRDIMQMEETYPNSSLNDDSLQIKIRYLNLIQSDLKFIQDHLYRKMLPLEDSDGWSMLKTEVSQGLYSIVMGVNPSRVKADDHPVDSVSWKEAKEFCQRMSWIIGKSVRLPTENEFRGALGRLRYLVIEDYAWTFYDSGGEAHRLGSKKEMTSGYADLLGNVSEWLESTDRYIDEAAKHIGGHAQDSPEAIFTVPVRNLPRGERSRMVGFRIAAHLE